MSRTSSCRYTSRLHRYAKRSTCATSDRPFSPILRNLFQNFVGANSSRGRESKRERRRCFCFSAEGIPVLTFHPDQSTIATRDCPLPGGTGNVHNRAAELA